MAGGAGFELTAPPDAVLDRMVIWRTGYRFARDGTAQGPWVVPGYRADDSVIGGPLTGETCVIAPGQPFCRLGAEGAMAPGARVERDLETTKVLYSVACLRDAGRTTANDQGFPLAGLSIAGSIVTLRENTLPRVTAGGALVAPGWRTDDAPLTYSASDGVGISRERVLVDGAEGDVVRPTCDYRAMVPRAQQPALDRGRWRIFASTRARGASARWSSTYRFGSRTGTYRIRARIRREGTLPFELGYSKLALVRVG